MIPDDQLAHGSDAPNTIPASELESLKQSLAAKENELAELKGSLENLKESFDSALEELALRGGRLDANDIDDLELEDEELVDEQKPSVQSPPQAPAKQDTSVDKDTSVDFEEKIEEAIQEDLNFRETILINQEKMELKEELNEALRKYPEANKTEVLLQIEEGIEENNPNQIEVLAKASHEKRLAEKESIRKATEEELRARLEKEFEGRTSIPQSQSSSSGPSITPPSGVGPIHELRNEDEEWGAALERARQVGA